MPHLVILYTPNLEVHTDVTALCRRLADTMLAIRDEADQPVFPTGGTRVLAYPAAHCAVADGAAEYGFIYLQLRIGAGRTSEVHTATGEALLNAVHEHLADLFASLPLGCTVQIDESRNQVYDGRHSTLHPLFSKSRNHAIERSN